MTKRPFFWLPRISKGVLGWTYLRWGRKLWRIW